MPQIITFPSTAVHPGTTVLGSVRPDSGDDSFLIVIDRTVAGGLNETPATGPWAFQFGVDVSIDSGTTWQGVGACSCPGMDQQGDLNNLDGPIPAGVANRRRVRAWFTVPPDVASLQIAGSAQSGVNLSA